MTGPQKIMIIRHGEKPDGGASIGVDENGLEDKHSLTVRGWQRAGALVAFFDVPHRSGIVRPSTIVASRREPAHSGIDDPAGRRAQQTVGPLRERIGVAYSDDIAVGAEDLVVERLRTASDVVLIAWEHKRIHNIAGGFLSNQAPEWPADRYDLVWILDRVVDEYRLSVLNQNLLAGDRPA